MSEEVIKITIEIESTKPLPEPVIQAAKEAFKAKLIEQCESDPQLDAKIRCFV